MRASTTEPVLDKSVPNFPVTAEYIENNKTKMYPFMLIGKNGTERLFKCFQATELEKRLMKLADKIVMITSAGQIHCQHNLLQWLVSSVDKTYDFHTDANEWTTNGENTEDTYTSSMGIPLPSIENAFTLTIAITRFPDPQKAVKITWKREISGDNARWSVVMSGNDIHFQLPKTQAFGILHAGEKCTPKEMEDLLLRLGKRITQSLTSTEDLADLSSNKEGNWRMVLSFRQVVSATSCPACYLHRFDSRPHLLKKDFLGTKDDEIFRGPLSIMENSLISLQDASLHPDVSNKKNNEKIKDTAAKDAAKRKSQWRKVGAIAGKRSEWRKQGNQNSKQASKRFTQGSKMNRKRRKSESLKSKTPKQKRSLKKRKTSPQESGSHCDSSTDNKLSASRSEENTSKSAQDTDLDQDCESLGISSTSSDDLDNDSEFKPNSKSETDSEQQVSEDGNDDDIDNDSILSGVLERGDGMSSNQSIQTDHTSVRSSPPSSPGNHSKTQDSVQNSTKGANMNQGNHESHLEKMISIVLIWTLHPVPSGMFMKAVRLKSI
jgi:hypothetical protein